MKPSHNVIPKIVPSGDNDALINAFDSYSLEEKKAVYNDYLTAYGKQRSDPADWNQHFINFQKCLGTIKAHNQSDSSFRQGINNFTDLDGSEAGRYLGFRAPDDDA